MAKKTNCTINGKEYYRIYRKVGMKLNKLGIWVDDRKAFYGSCKREAEEQYQEYMQRKKAAYPMKSRSLGNWQTAIFIMSLFMTLAMQIAQNSNISTHIKGMCVLPGWPDCT